MMEINGISAVEDIKFQFDIVKPMCRCCLISDRRMFRVAMYDFLFKDLAGIDVSESDGLPQYLCWECSALLRKAVRFKQKMLRAHALLYEYSTRCAPFPIDAQDPELTKYASPQLCETNVLYFELGSKNKPVNTDAVTHSNLLPPTELDVLPTIPLPTFVEKSEDIIKDEIEFASDFDYDDNIALTEYKTKSTPDDVIKEILGSSNLADNRTKVKRKTKKKEDKAKKKSASEVPTDAEATKEPKSSIRKTIEIDPTKIRIITLNPEEQVKQREEESKTSVKFPYQCNLCYKGFNFQTKLDNHMKKHSPSRGSFSCQLCHMFLPTTYSLSVHNLIHTTRYECRQCGRQMIDRASIVEHYRTQHEGQMTQYTCDICGKVSNNNKTHRGHMRNHHSGARPKCDQCGKTFVNKDGLAEHIMIHQGVKNYECDTCGKRFRTRTQVKLHQTKHTDARDYYCVECDIRFKTAYTLRQHLQKSLKHKDFQSFQFVCPNCDKRFETDRALQTHIMVQHQGVKAYRCQQCPNALATRASLMKHILSVHRGLRPPPRHVCDTCGKAFRAKSVLTNHVRTHTGEKPFVCAHCGRGFTQRTSMYTHVKLVHLKIRRRAKIKPEASGEESKVFKNDTSLDAWTRPQTSDLYYVPV